jgi:hypothetical protein
MPHHLVKRTAQRVYIAVAVAIVVFLVAMTAAALWSKSGALTIADAGDLATVAAAIVTAITLFSILWQLRQQAELARAANSQSFVNISSEFLLHLANDPILAELWQRGAEYESFTIAQKAQYRALVQWWLNFFENLLYQHQRGLIDDDVYDAWCKDERNFVGRRHVEKVWPEVQKNYSDAFFAHFNELVANRLCKLAREAVASGTAPPCE